MGHITLDELRSQKRWLAHREKRLFSAITGRASDWSNPGAWSDHATACAVGGKHVGVVIGDGIVCIDLDDCLWRDDSGKKPVMRIKPVFKPLFDLVMKHGVYAEISQSKGGLHMFLCSDWEGTIKVKLPQPFALDHWTEKTGVEVYGGREPDGRAKRFMATTFDTARCGRAGAIIACDEVLEAALTLAGNAKAAAVELKGGAPVEVQQTVHEPMCVSLPAAKPDAKTTTDNEDDVVAPLTSVRPENGLFYALNRLAVIAADLWFPALFEGARKHGVVWRGTTPGASCGDISLSPQGIRWWKDDDVKTPVDVVMLSQYVRTLRPPKRPFRNSLSGV
jgi:hypothetical protein